jgi:hypothetical protein
MIMTRAGAAALMLTLLVAARAPPVFPNELQWTWGNDLSACEAELTRGIVIRAGSVSFYDGPERLVGSKGPEIWRSPKGQAKTYLFTFLTDSPEGVGRNSDRKKPYTMRYTVVGRNLYISEAASPAADQFKPRNRMVKCPKKIYR